MSGEGGGGHLHLHSADVRVDLRDAYAIIEASAASLGSIAEANRTGQLEVRHRVLVALAEPVAGRHDLEERTRRWGALVEVRPGSEPVAHEMVRVHLDQRDPFALEEQSVDAARLHDRVDDLADHGVLQVELEPADHQLGMAVALGQADRVRPRVGVGDLGQLPPVGADREIEGEHRLLEGVSVALKAHAITMTKGCRTVRRVRSCGISCAPQPDPHR